MNQHISKWNAERDELAKQLWTDGGWSAAEIAARLGSVSRNAVIGRMHRLGIHNPHTDKARTRSQANTDNRLKMRMRRPEHVLAPAPKPTSRSTAAVATNPVRYLDRRMHRECATILNFGAPVENLMCCGAPIEVGSGREFCEACAGKFFYTPDPRRQRRVA